jgi:hypothetical protein
LESDRDLKVFPSAIGKDGYTATVGAASRRGDFGNRSVVMTAVVKVLPEPPLGLQFAPARFLEEDRMKKDIRIAALPIALLSIVVGIVGIASPDGGMTLRRLLFATPGLFYAVVAVRSAMGLGLILAASSSRWPRTLWALGAVVCLQGLSATLLGPDHGPAIMEWEGMQGSALLRAGAAVALASGGFIVFAVS